MATERYKGRDRLRGTEDSESVSYLAGLVLCDLVVGI